MAKNLQINLTFSADTTAAKQQIQQLQQALSNAASQPMQSQGINTMRQQIAAAQTDALQLKIALQNATNINTGKINFNKFSQELKKNKMTLEQYAISLKKLGPQGTQAFSQLANAIRQSEMPIVSLKGKVAALGKTLANTARWQISSMMLQGLMSAFSNTINYAKDLNESLNNIRIVTGKSIENMAEFAKQANKAAKALSASTTEYTDASLIYYQQGLSDEEVKERTEVTLKLAKVVGEEAAVVSEWMTAIWNNFDNGSQALEHYADVITALGAATASSADEIAGGLEKFAAVAETVGLSYEYAASALATITSETRQSEDVVGTALKTIFARIEGLSLGDTLEDGTTLNQYSEALYKVGVNIKDQNGNLKKMDNILNEIGNKWQLLNKDQQVALAQSVAGIRQYNQFIALMANWDVMQENLEISRSATGEVERQLQIYEEGIEGSTARIQAQLESIKNTILDENDLIPLLDIADDFLEVIDSLLKSMGGLPGVLLLITGLVTKAFGPQIAGGIASMTSGISSLYGMMNGSAQAERKSSIVQSANLASKMAVSDTAIGHEESVAISSALTENAELTQKEEASIDKINSQYKETLQLLRQIIEEKQKIIQQSGKEYDEAVEEGEQAETALRTAGVSDTDINTIRNAGAYQGQVNNFEKTNFSSGERAKDAAASITQVASDTLGQESAQVKALTASYEKLTKAEDNYTKAAQIVKQAKKENRKLTEEEKRALESARKERDKQRTSFSKTAKSIDVAGAAKRKYKKENNETSNAVEKLINAEEKGAAATERSSRAVKDKEASVKRYNATLQEGVVQGKHWTEGFVSGVSTLTSVASGVMMVTNSITSVVEAAKNGELTFSTFMGAATGLLMSLGMFAPVITGITKAMKAHNLSGLQGLGILTAEWLMTKLSTKAKRDKIRAIQAEEQADAKANLKKIASIFFNIGEQASQGPKGWITAAISAALVAALIGVAIAVNAGNKAQNDEEEKEAQRTSNYAKTVSEAYDKVRESYEKLKESLENYKSAQEAIGKLQKGTLEWKQAISEANQQVVELIEQYPELIKYVNNTEGRLTISDEGMQAVLEKQNQQVTTLANVKANANLKADQARYEADKEAALTTKFDTAGAWEFIGRIVAGVTIGSFVGGPVLGTAMGLTDAIVNNKNEYDQSKAALETISQAYLEQGESIFVDLEKTFQDLKITDPELITALKENKDGLEKLVRTNSQLIEQEKFIEQQKTDNLLYSQSHFISENYGKGVQEAATKEYQKLKQEGKEKWGEADDYSFRKWYSLGIAAGGTDKGEAAFAEYAKLMGYEGADATNFKGNKVIFKYKDGDDVKKDLEVTYEEIEEALAEASVADQAYRLANNVNQMTSEVRVLQNSNELMDQALGSFLENGNLSYLDPEVYEKIINKNVQISEDQAALFGYDSVAAAEEAFSKALDNYDAAIAKTNILAREQQAINTILADGAAELEQSETALRAYAESLSTESEYLSKNKEMAAKLAVQHYRVAIGVKDLKKALKDNLKVLEDNTLSSLDYYEALGAVKDSLEKAFGIKVSADFVEKNLEKIKSLANDDVEALQSLKKELIQDFILNLSIDDEYKTVLQSEISELMTLAENNPIGMELEFNNSKAIEGINQALEVGAMTVGEVEALFANANLAMPQYNIAKVPNTTTSQSHTTSTIENQWGGKQTVTSDSTTSTTTWSEIPYFGDNPPVYEKNSDGEYVKKSGTGVESSFKVTSMGNQNADQDILSYGGKGTEAGETAEEKKKRLKNLDDEIDHYHELKEAINDVSRELGQLSTAKDRAFGKAKLKYMDAEIEKLEEQIALQDELASRMELDLINDQAELNSWGFSTDASGRISNYKDVYAKRLAEYNALTMTDKDTADEKWEEFKKAVQKYEETLNSLEDAQAEAIELRYELEEKRLENIQTIVEENIEITNDKLATLEYQMSKIEDDAFAAADAIALIGQQTDAVVENLKHYESGIREVLKMETANGSRMTDEEVDRLLGGDMSVLQGKELTSNQIEALREYRDNIYETNQELQEYADSINEKVVEYFEAANEKLERQGELLERNQKILENYRNIIDLVGADNLGISSEVISRMNQQMVKNADATLQHARIMRDQTKAAYEEAAAAGILSEEELNTLYDAYLDAEENFNDSWVSALEVASEAFENEAQRILDDFDKALGGLEEKLDWFEKLQERNEIFYKDYEKTYEISKLNRQIAESIDTTDNLRGQRALSKIQQELLEYQKQGKELSKYDLEYLQKKYDLELARIALEEAQNAKSQVRLTRDSSGNYGYIYTADANAVANAEQTYEDKLYALEKFLDESETAIQKQILSWNKEMMEALGELDKSAEDYDEKAKSVVDHYTSLINSLSDEGQEILQRGKEMNEEYGTHAAEVFNETIMGKLYTDINSYQEFNALMMEAVSSTLEKLEDNHSTWQQNTSDIFDSAGKDIEDFKEDVVEYLDEIDGKNKEILETTSSMAQEMDSDFDAIVKAAEIFKSNYESTINPIITQNEALADSINKVIASYKALDDPELNALVEEVMNRASEAAKDKTITADKGDGNQFEDLDTDPPDTWTPKYSKNQWVEITDPELKRQLTNQGEDTIFQIGNVSDKNQSYYLKGYGNVKENQITASDTASLAKITPLFGIGEEVASKEQRQDGGVNMVGVFEKDDLNSRVDFWFGSQLNGKKISNIDIVDGQVIYQLEGLEGSSNQYWFKESQLVKFDTGGYTGIWGSEGRLAMLHQKELILNAHDTENFLTAVQIVRSMSDQLEANARAAQYGMSELRAAAGLPQQGTLEQNVHIEASFPNATNHSEIEEAFGNLVNLAAQYANRK